MFKDSSSPVKTSSFNPLNPDLLSLYRRQNPIKIWPIYAVLPTTTLYPAKRTTYWKQDHPRPFFNQLKNLSRSPWPLISGPTNPRCILDQHTPSPIKARSLPIRLFPIAGESGVDRLSDVNAKRTTYWKQDHPRPFFNQLKNLSRSPWPLISGPTNPRCILDQHTPSPIKARSLPIRLFSHSGGERGWSALWCERAFTYMLIFVRDVIVTHYLRV